MKRLLIITIALSGGVVVGCTFKEHNVRETETSVTGVATIDQHNTPISHECAGEEGYVWSEVRQECIRVLETGIRTDATDGSQTSAFIVFNNDSSQAEIFFSDSRPNEIINRRPQTDGQPEWATSEQKGKRVYLNNGIWTISQQQKYIFSQPKEETDSTLGDLQIRTYSGLLPAASGPGIHYLLTIRNREYGGDGMFMLIMTYLEAKNGEDESFEYIGKRYTLRGMAGNNDATVWQLKAEDGTIFNFLYDSNENTLTLLNDNLEKAETTLNYTLQPEE